MLEIIFECCVNVKILTDVFTRNKNISRIVSKFKAKKTFHSHTLILGPVKRGWMNNRYT